MHSSIVAALHTCELWCPQYFVLMAVGLFAAFIPRGLPAPISCHAWTQAATQSIYNSQQSSLIRKAICIFCKVHLHSQGFLFLFMLNPRTAKQSILGVPSCHSLLEHKVKNLSLVLQLRLSFLEHSRYSRVFGFTGGNLKKCFI